MVLECLDDGTMAFNTRLKTFLRAMKRCEEVAMQQGQLQEEQRLSNHMHDSWESGDFWVMYAALNSFAFDRIYWQKIVQRFFGPAESFQDAWKERLHLLEETEREEMELLVTRKLQEMDTRVLLWDPDEYTVAFREQLKSRKVKERKDEEK
ncbi:phosphotransferase family protein [Penicillium malachiteum]|uniref:Phosphotransferase family protein n=1 Tax=Penicillium malachiteum TaxID=1324776 RepID=A0AAD6HFW2_9EURO|nr:phosphotransferase family protein [Penicillium malachiteum]